MDGLRHLPSAAPPLSSRFPLHRPAEDRTSRSQVSSGSVVDATTVQTLIAATTEEAVRDGSSLLLAQHATTLSLQGKRTALLPVPRTGTHSGSPGGLQRSDVPASTERGLAMLSSPRELQPPPANGDNGQPGMSPGAKVVDMTPLVELTNSTAEALRLAVTLDVSSRKLGDAKLSSLLPCIGELTQLRGLWLANNGVKGDTTTGNSKSATTESGALWDNFESALRRLPQLQSITLHNNALGPRGAEALARSLPIVTNLEVLSLHNNPLNPDGVEHLCRALPSLGRLVLLYVSNTNMGDTGATALAGAIVSLSGMRKLYAAANGISDRGAHSLLAAFHRLPKLQEVFLNNNVISGDGVAALRKVNILNLVV